MTPEEHAALVATLERAQGDLETVRVALMAATPEPEPAPEPAPEPEPVSGYGDGTYGEGGYGG